MSKSLLRAVCWMMMICVPMSTALAQSANAMLHLQGVVRVNGLNVTRSVAIFEGDSVETQAGAASIAAPGAMVTLASNSKLTYRKDGLRLVHGSAGFTSEKGLKVQAATVAVAPKTAKGQFQVAAGPQGILVAALNGAVLVSTAKGVTEIPQGQSMTFLEAAAQEPCKPGEVRNSAGECVRQAAGTNVPQNTGGNMGSNTGGMIVGLASVIASAAIAIAATSAAKPSSPVNP